MRIRNTIGYGTRQKRSWTDVRKTIYAGETSKRNGMRIILKGSVTTKVRGCDKKK